MAHNNSNFALEQNKEVYAVPGPIFNNTSEGVHKLIQDGAKCVHSSQDIFEDFNLNQIKETPGLFDSQKFFQKKNISLR